jgi:hypothetical protein
MSPKYAVSSVSSLAVRLEDRLDSAEPILAHCPDSASEAWEYLLADGDGGVRIAVRVAVGGRSSMSHCPDSIMLADEARECLLADGDGGVRVAVRGRSSTDHCAGSIMLADEARENLLPDGEGGVRVAVRVAVGGRSSMSLEMLKTIGKVVERPPLRDMAI